MREDFKGLCELWKKHHVKCLKAELEQSAGMVSTCTVTVEDLASKEKDIERRLVLEECLDKAQSFWANVLRTKPKIELSGNAHQLFVYRRHNESSKEKITVQAWWRIHSVCCLWYWRPWLYHRNHEI